MLFVPLNCSTNIRVWVTASLPADARGRVKRNGVTTNKSIAMNYPLIEIHYFITLPLPFGGSMQSAK